MNRPEKSVLAAKEVEMEDYDQNEKNEAGDEDFNVWDGNPFPPIPGVSEYETRQLTVRSLVFGALIGCVAAASNVYLGLMIGWGFGAGMIAAMLGFAAVKSVSTKLPQRFGGGFFGPKENCSIQTSANAAASGSSIYVAAVPAMYQLQLLLNPVSDLPRLLTLSLVSAFFGTFFAVPLRKFTILKQKLPFPTGTATAVLIRSLHLPRADDDVRKKLKCLYIALAISLAWKVGGGYAKHILIEWNFWGWLANAGCEKCQGGARFNWNPELAPEFFGVGILTGLHVSASFLLGAVLSNGIIGPILQAKGVTKGVPMSMRMADPIHAPTMRYWLLWPGVLCMIAASLADVGVNFRPIYDGTKAALLELWNKIFKRRSTGEVAYTGIEDPATPAEQIPLWVWTGGLLVSIVLTWIILKLQFNIPVAHSTVAIIMGFVMSLVATQASGATDINPVGAMGKVAQFMVGGITRAQHTALKEAQLSNLCSGSVVAQAAHHSVDLLSDLKTGHLLQASPKGQFWAQLFGSLISIFPATGLFIMFTKAWPCILDAQAETCKFKLPAVMAWKAVAEAMTQDKLPIPPSSGWTAVGLAILTVTVIVVRHFWVPTEKHKWVINMNTIDLAMIVVTPNYPLAMFWGALVRWWAENSKKPNIRRIHELYSLPFATGIIAGWTLGGAVEAALEMSGIGSAKYGSKIGA